MIIQQQILRLNSAGRPTGWINYQDAVRLYCSDQVSYECGTSSLRIRGGYNRLLNKQSSILLNSIVATHNVGKFDYSLFTPALSNETLFKRDNHHCMYCGQEFARKNLSRDHVIPLSHGGRDVWTNVVTACRRCNNAKGGITPEDAQMLLIAIPFVPSRIEYIFLKGRKILADQMEFLMSHIPKSSPIFERYKRN